MIGFDSLARATPLWHKAKLIRRSNHQTIGLLDWGGDGSSSMP
jgi:hypothetical protein